jgi:hypothetical protein
MAFTGALCSYLEIWVGVKIFGGMSGLTGWLQHIAS